MSALLFAGCVDAESGWSEAPRGVDVQLGTGTSEDEDYSPSIFAGALIEAATSENSICPELAVRG